MRACWLKWVGRDWSISADYIWLNYSGANIGYQLVLVSDWRATFFATASWAFLAITVSIEFALPTPIITPSNTAIS